MKKFAFSLLTGLALTASTADAQVLVSGTTSGCFYLTTDVNSCISTPLTFTGGSFSVNAQPGYTYILNDMDDFLGRFTLASNTNYNFGDPLRFRLTVTFTSPTSVTPNPVNFSADFDGDVNVNDNGDELNVDFNNDWQFMNYAGGNDSYFYFRVNDVDELERDMSNGLRLSGAIACAENRWDDICTPPAPASVPEPASLGLLMAGLAGLGVVARRRRA